MIRKMLIIFVTTIVVSSLVLTSTAIVSLASELDTTTIKPDVYKNDSYIDAPPATRQGKRRARRSC